MKKKRRVITFKDLSWAKMHFKQIKDQRTLDDFKKKDKVH